MSWSCGRVFRGVLERLYGSTRDARLSPAALEVLALVAYRQPLGKSEIDSLRGGEISERRCVSWCASVWRRCNAAPRISRRRCTTRRRAS